MTSGNEHDKSTIFWIIPFGLVVTICLDINCGILGGIAFGFGGLWLSPDLDTKSKSLKRWGIFKSIWWPYRKFIKHRSILSHGPLIGTSLRIVYLTSVTGTSIALLQSLDLASSFLNWSTTFDFLKNNQQELVTIILGLEASAWLHLVKDGDPLPKEWVRKKKR